MPPLAADGYRRDAIWREGLALLLGRFEGDAMLPQIRAVIQGAETDGVAIDTAKAHALTARANTLVNDAQRTKS